MSRRLLKAIHVASPLFNMVKSGDGFLHLAHQNYRNCCVARAPGTQGTDTEGRIPCSGGIFELLFASGHTPRTPNGWAAFSASKPCCFFKLVAPASHRRNRARFPHKSPPVGVGEPGKGAIPMTLKTTGHHARPLQRLVGGVMPECNAATVRFVSRILTSAYFYILSHSSLSIICEGK